MSWKRMKGLVKATNTCPDCRGLYPDEDYDFEEDKCFYCLFPEMSKGAVVPIDSSYGFNRNVTSERQLLDNLEDIPEVQSEKAKESYRAYQWRNYKKKSKPLYKVNK